ncbi:MAG: sugar transferase [Armatimonadetes bacterium]|nr:sugar transferase [Armatimonadota bacterium]
MTPASDLNTITNGAPLRLVEHAHPAPTVTSHGGSFKVLVLVADVMAAAVAVWAAHWLLSGAGQPAPSAAMTWSAAAVMAACWTLGLITGRLYTFRPRRSSLVWALQILICLGGGTLLAVALSFFVGSSFPFDRTRLLLATLLGWPLCYLWRMLAVRFGPAYHVRDRLLLLGTDDRARTLVSNLQHGHNAQGAEILGAVRLPGEPNDDFPCSVLGELDDCISLASRLEANVLVVAPTPPVTADVMHCAAHCDAMGICVWSMETAFEELTLRAPVFHVGSVWEAQLESAKRSRYATRLKRYADVAVTLLLMPLALVLIGLCALLTKLLSPGPVFYRQERVGKDGQIFDFIKIRTMVVDAEKHTGPVWATANDPRITPLGRLLRKTRLDELPQLFLVLKGDMSLVGPRPERPFFVEQFSREIPLYERRLMVRPGITGWAQIHHNYDRNTDDVIEKLRYDLYYIRRLSFSLDLEILIKTVGVMLRTQGAH